MISILVVDDEAGQRQFISGALKEHEIITAANGEEAVQLLSHRSVSLVVTDQRMPKMSGKELFNWIKKNRQSLADRIIFVTGDTVSMETRSFFEENQSFFLAKPFKIEEVRQVIQTVLQTCPH